MNTATQPHPKSRRIRLPPWAKRFYPWEKAVLGKGAPLPLTHRDLAIAMVALADHPRRIHADIWEALYPTNGLARRSVRAQERLARLLAWHLPLRFKTEKAGLRTLIAAGWAARRTERHNISASQATREQLALAGVEATVELYRSAAPHPFRFGPAGSPRVIVAPIDWCESVDHGAGFLFVAVDYWFLRRATYVVRQLLRQASPIADQLSTPAEVTLISLDDPAPGIVEGDSAERFSTPGPDAAVDSADAVNWIVQAIGRAIADIRRRSVHQAEALESWLNELRWGSPALSDDERNRRRALMGKVRHSTDWALLVRQLQALRHLD
jgi:hypothetical protein